MAGFLEEIINNQKCRPNNYIIELLEKARKVHGEESTEYKGIFNQYFLIPDIHESDLKNRRHYEADVCGTTIKGLERLYRRSVVIDLLSACACECIYCLRGYYEKFSLTDSEIKGIVNYCSKDIELREVLITGGDPFISTYKLKLIITELAEKAPNIKIIRIGTRLPVQDPFKFDDTFYQFFDTLKKRFYFEIGLQVNHYFELQDKSCEIIRKLQNAGCRIYAQNVLLRNVNDNIETLFNLYDELRYVGVVPHYLFHPVPMKGTDKFRTTVQKGIDLIRKLTSSGYISGRAKPQFALMTDVGKVILYHDTIVGKEEKYLIIKTEYKLNDRIKWNPSYIIPPSAIINSDDTITVKYLNGVD